VIRRIVEDPTNPISDVRVFDLRESMRNGGGPACLRLRVVLDEDQRETVNAASWINAESCGTLKTWVERHYRDRLAFEDLADPQLLDESRGALDQLTQMLNLGSIYDFQR
ncbi:MAG: N-succinylarginine dihydrolase, partial [Stenotrophobium sp.]